MMTTSLAQIDSKSSARWYSKLVQTHRKPRGPA